MSERDGGGRPGDRAAVDMAHLQRLARLDLDAEQAETLAADVAEILAYFDQLAEVDTEGVEEMVRPVVPQRPWRDDTAAPSLPRERVLELANASQDGFVRVPRTVEED
ncbi:MAG TPA: Asp-tRNA(Asn)/Glu-tRNA(Gln) amidotransferase subunit GatC [Trueperaceae bacterium]|nr:Asp-tRNA(Asn)/Glu-tRNA(Gln) amidotransferase subunit GatC [Trueperaceae bacterium]